MSGTKNILTLFATLGYGARCERESIQVQVAFYRDNIYVFNLSQHAAKFSSNSVFGSIYMNNIPNMRCDDDSDAVYAYIKNQLGITGDNINLEDLKSKSYKNLNCFAIFPEFDDDNMANMRFMVYYDLFKMCGYTRKSVKKNNNASALTVVITHMHDNITHVDYNRILCGETSYVAKFGEIVGYSPTEPAKNISTDGVTKYCYHTDKFSPTHIDSEFEKTILRSFKSYFPITKNLVNNAESYITYIEPMRQLYNYMSNEFIAKKDPYIRSYDVFDNHNFYKKKYTCTNLSIRLNYD